MVEEAISTQKWGRTFFLPPNAGTFTYLRMGSFLPSGTVPMDVAFYTIDCKYSVAGVGERERRNANPKIGEAKVPIETRSPSRRNQRYETADFRFADEKTET